MTIKGFIVALLFVLLINTGPWICSRQGGGDTAFRDTYRTAGTSTQDRVRLFHVIFYMSG